MCGRFDTSHLYWRDIHAQLSSFLPVRNEPLNLDPNDDVRPTTEQLVAHVEDSAWTLAKMRWGLVSFWRSGKPLNDTAKGADDGFKLTTFNCKVETCHSAATFPQRLRQAPLRVVPASAWYEWTGDNGGRPSTASRAPMGRRSGSRGCGTAAPRRTPAGCGASRS